MGNEQLHKDLMYQLERDDDLQNSVRVQSLVMRLVEVEKLQIYHMEESNIDFEDLW